MFEVSMLVWLPQTNARSSYSRTVTSIVSEIKKNNGMLIGTTVLAQINCS